MLQEVEHPALGKVRLPRLPVQLSESAVGITSSPPLLGQHTEEVLAERLGLTREQIEALEAQGVIQTWTNK
jgi:crotonobetainyl-CoA:carnitine CoA-transferase CaiB-like acyl-CoA transferase